MSGRAWLFGDDVDTDAIAPGAWMKFDIATLARHCLERLDPAFARAVRPGDVLVAGRNFGCGSSREQAPQALKHLGLAAVVARSFAGLFYRNAVNLGLPVLECDALARVAPLAEVDVDLEQGSVRLVSSGETLRGAPMPEFLLEIVRAGGLLNQLEGRLARARERKPA
ncbi:MAG: 3-isopropylmalate dehydratase [Burkholderiales bacterium]|nr:3-isopropylmalate dehydratase [Burkholderiales bacterium]